MCVCLCLYVCVYDSNVLLLTNPNSLWMEFCNDLDWLSNKNTFLQTSIGKCQHIRWQIFSYLAFLCRLLLLLKSTIILFYEGTKIVWHSKPAPSGLYSEREVKLFQAGWMIVLYKIWLQSRRNLPASLWTFACLRKLAFLERGKLLSSSSLWDQWLSKVIKYERESTSLCVLQEMLRWKTTLVFWPLKENCLVFSSCHGYTMS